MRIRDIMTSNPACAMPDTPLQQVAQMMIDCDCGQIPVVSDKAGAKPIGVVTDRDIVCRAVAQGRNPLEMTAREVMSSPVATVRPEDDLEVVRRVLEDHRVRRVPVVDERGRCCGIVSQADLAQRAPERLTAEVVRVVSMANH